MDSTPLTTNISPQQYQWLKARLACNSDAVACELSGFTKDQVRHWKRSTSFSTLLGLVRTSPRQALQALAFVLAGSIQLEAIERLVLSRKGSDVKAGLDALDRLKKGMEDVGDEAGYHQIINILNLRGDVPPQVQAFMPRRQLPVVDGAYDVVS